ncbi:DUF1778 domain-containing protein [uncultured Alsobacter sp.]|uniref:type II toxin-antitoxin system TacA family antitoxin n=1 Tax=uncultured Alsobacter sp. TaxID=1748258 RepID=UPI0025F5C785|nr:DUF1778 domain-containing protein [uncultured Alsobacter sp.]
MSKPARSEKVDLRISPTAKLALREAAALRHKTVSEFVLESALERAEQVLAAQTTVRLDTQDWEAFVQALDAEPKALAPKLERLMTTRSVFEDGRRPKAVARKR